MYDLLCVRDGLDCLAGWLAECYFVKRSEVKLLNCATDCVVRALH